MYKALVSILLCVSAFFASALKNNYTGNAQRFLKSNLTNQQKVDSISKLAFTYVSIDSAADLQIINLADEISAKIHKTKQNKGAVESVSNFCGLNIKSRISFLNGQVEIASKEDKVILVNVFIPLQR